MRAPTGIRLQFRRHRAPDVGGVLLDLPEWLRGPSTCPAEKPSPAEPAPAPAPPVLTNTMRDLLRIITRLAANGYDAPNNPQLGSLASGRCRCTVLRALRRLEDVKLIAIEHAGSRRRFTILSTGHTTDWGEARPGHAPYSRFARGERPAVVARIRAPNSRALAPQTPAGTAYRPPVVVGAATTCQWPLSMDFAGKGKHEIFCSAPCVAEYSFCPDHVGRVYRTVTKKLQPRGAGVGKTPAVLSDPRFKNAIVDISDLFG